MKKIVFAVTIIMLVDCLYSQRLDFDFAGNKKLNIKEETVDLDVPFTSPGINKENVNKLNYFNREIKNISEEYLISKCETKMILNGKEVSFKWGVGADRDIYLEKNNYNIIYLEGLFKYVEAYEMLKSQEDKKDYKNNGWVLESVEVESETTENICPIEKGVVGDFVNACKKRICKVIKEVWCRLVCLGYQDPVYDGCKRECKEIHKTQCREE